MRHNTGAEWGSVSITLHWLIAGLILLVQVPIGLIMVSLAQGAAQNVMFTTHKLVGITIFLLACFRLGWRLKEPVPSLPADMPDWQATLARINHVLLYAMLFWMPLNGFLYTALGGYPLPFFGLLDLGALIPDSKAAAGLFEAMHVYSQFLLYLLAATHVAGALHHRLQRRDGVFERMLPAGWRASPPPVRDRTAPAHQPGRR
jgi:cytochrome b561